MAVVAVVFFAALIPAQLNAAALTALVLNAALTGCGLGYVPEEAHVYPALTGMEYLQLMGRLRELPERVVNEKATDLLKLFSLYLHRHAPLASYSKGMKQRVLISAALLHDPDILIFDEPLSGLDVSSSLLFKHLVAELAARGKII